MFFMIFGIDYQKVFLHYQLFDFLQTIILIFILIIIVIILALINFIVNLTIIQFIITLTL